jgi:hypothetical protein
VHFVSLKNVRPNENARYEQYKGLYLLFVDRMSELLETAKNVIQYTTPLTQDVCEVGEAIFTDFIQKKKKRPTKRTVRAVASVTLGVAAADAGGFVGGIVGGAIGALFGGAGAVPGAFIGEVVGGIVGSIGASTAAKAVVNECVSSDSEDSD